MTSQNLSFKEVLEKIARVNAMDYEYQRWAREALAAQPAPAQGPVKIGTIGHIDNGKATLTASILSVLQAAPPAAHKEWVGLTDDEISILAASLGFDPHVKDVIRKAEAKLREKNQ